MSWIAEQRFEAKRLRNLSVALWGACGGVLVTLLLLLPGLGSISKQAAAHLPNLSRVPVLESATIVPWQEPIEKRMYVLSCLCCPILAWLSLRLRSRVSAWACALSVVLFVPIVFNAYRGIFDSNPSPGIILAAALTLCLPALGRFRRREFGFPSNDVREEQNAALSEGTGLSCSSSQVGVSSGKTCVSQPSRRKMALWLLVLFFLFFFPYKIKDFSSAFFTQGHIASYLLGPSLSFLNPQLTPALDFESHYGLGHVYLFSYFLGSSMHQTLSNYVWFLFVAITFCYLSAFFVLTDFFGSTKEAFLVTLLLSAVGMEGWTYDCPSNWAIRYPFLFLFLGCAARETVLSRKWLAVALAGLLSGLSLFWQTDIGFFLVLAGISYYAVLTVRENRGFGRVPLFAFSAGSSLLLFCLIAFGTRTLSLAFFRRLLDPLLVYNSGFGFWLMNWHDGWPYLYNVIGPVVALATLGWCVQRFHSRNLQEQQEARFLFLCSMIGMLMLFKWVNRSIDPVWSINATGVIIVLYWWVRQATTVIGQAVVTRLGVQSQERERSIRSLTCAAVFLVLLGMSLVASCFQRQTATSGPLGSSPLARICRFVRETPTLANRVLRPIHSLKVWPCSLPVSQVDVELIRTHTSPTESVLILAPYDWVYLAEAHRAPGFFWIPVRYTYSCSLLAKIEQRIHDGNSLFVEKGWVQTLKKEHPEMYSIVFPLLTREFTVVDSGKMLDLYQRKSVYGIPASQVQDARP